MAEDLITSTFIKLKNRFLVQALSILYDTSSAEDVLMNAFLKVYQKKYNISDQKDAEHLLSRVIRNESISMKRQNRPHLNVDAIQTMEDEPPSEIDKSIQAMEKNMERYLSDTQKYIIRRNTYEGASLTQIAEELEMQEPAVRKQLSRARITLREALKDEE